MFPKLQDLVSVNFIQVLNPDEVRSRYPRPEAPESAFYTEDLERQITTFRKQLDELNGKVGDLYAPTVYWCRHRAYVREPKEHKAMPIEELRQRLFAEMNSLNSLPISSSPSTASSSFSSIFIVR